jgi:hypothetical protein
MRIIWEERRYRQKATILEVSVFEAGEEGSEGAGFSRPKSGWGQGAEAE